MVETASLVIKVDSSGAKRATSDLDRLGRSAQDAEGKIGLIPGAFKLIGTVAASAGVATATGAFLRMADASANLDARLRLATKGTEAFNKAQRDTFAIAQRASTDLESVVNLYARLAQSSTELGLSQDEVTQLTGTVTQAFQVSGATAQEAAGGIRQLTQALAGGTLRAEEFNSIIESSPRIVQALADEFGVSFGKVRQLVNDGKISSEDFARALLNASEQITTEFDQMPLTVGRATQQVRNSLQALVGDADSAGGASANLAQSISDLARTLESQEVKDGFATMVGGLASVIELAGKAGTAIDVLNRSRMAFAGVREQASSGIRMGLFGLSGQWDAVRQEYRQGYLPGSMKLDGAFAPGAPVAAPTASQGIADFVKAPTAPGERPRATATLDTSTGTVRGGRTPASPRGPSERDILDLSAYTREQVRAESATMAMQARLEDLRALMGGPLQQAALEYGRAVEAVRSAQAAGNLTTDEAAEYQRLLREQYDQTTKKIGEQATKLSEFGVQAARNAQDAFAGFLFDPFENGTTKMVENFSNAMRRILAEMASAKALQALGSALSGYAGAGSGWVNALGAAMQGGGGRAFGGPVQAGQSYRVGERGEAEIFTPGTSGRITPMGQAPAPRVHLQVINNGQPMQATTQQTTQPDGSQLIRLVLNAVGDSIASGSGTPYAAIKGRFGLRDQMG